LEGQVSDQSSVLQEVPNDLQRPRHTVVSDVDSAVRLLKSDTNCRYAIQ
jgi:hypothetical protein